MYSLSIELSLLTICYVGDSITGHRNTYKQDKHGTSSSGIFITIQNKLLKVTKVIIRKIIWYSQYWDCDSLSKCYSMGEAALGLTFRWLLIKWRFWVHSNYGKPGAGWAWCLRRTDRKTMGLGGTETRGIIHHWWCIQELHGCVLCVLSGCA